MKWRKIGNAIMRMIILGSIAVIIVSGFNLGKQLLIEQEKVVQQVRVLGHTIENNQKLMDKRILELYRHDIDLLRYLDVIVREINPPDFNLITKATVKIINMEKATMGSGVCIIYEGYKYILSAFHLDESEEIYVDDGGNYIKLKVLLADKGNDLILFTMTEELNTVEYINFIDNETKAGDKIWVCGNPMGIIDALTYGIIVRKGNDKTEFLVDAAVWFGNSGGGAFNSKSELIGIASKIMYDIMPMNLVSRSYGIFVDINTIEDFLNQLN